MGSVGGKRVEYNLFTANPSSVLVCLSSFSSWPVFILVLSSLIAIAVHLVYAVSVYVYFLYSTLFVSFDTVWWGEGVEEGERCVTGVYVTHMVLNDGSVLSTFTCWVHNFADWIDKGKSTSGPSGFCFTTIYWQILSHALIPMCMICVNTYPHKFYTWPTGGLLEPLAQFIFQRWSGDGGVHGWQGI